MGVECEWKLFFRHLWQVWRHRAWLAAFSLVPKPSPLTFWERIRLSLAFALLWFQVDIHSRLHMKSQYATDLLIRQTRWWTWNGVKGYAREKSHTSCPFLPLRDFFTPPPLPLLLNKEVRWLPKSEQMLFMDIYLVSALSRLSYMKASIFLALVITKPTHWGLDSSPLHVIWYWE